MIGTFLASEIRLLIRILASRRIDAQRILREAGINPALADQPRARVPFEKVAAAWSRAVQICDAPDLGLEAVEFYRPTDFHGLAVVFLASNNLGTALERFVRYHTVVNTALKVKLARSDNRFDLLCSSPRVDAAATRTLESARAAVIVDLCRTAVSGGLDPMSVAFTYAQPADTRAYDDFFYCRLEFGAPEWRLSFRGEDAARPFLASNRDLARSNDQVLDHLVKSLHQDDLVSRVKVALVDQLPSGTPSEESIARAVSMSARSLQRRLAGFHTNFKQLLASVRRELAEQYVQDRDVPVTEISYMLGFSDLSSFSRAFKRWTGRSPAACRQRSASG